MQQAADDLAGWQKQIGDAPLSVSVNLSSRQLIRRDLVSDVRSVIARANLEAALLPARTHRIAGHGQSRAVRPCADQEQYGKAP